MLSKLCVNRNDNETLGKNEGLWGHGGADIWYDNLLPTFCLVQSDLSAFSHKDYLIRAP